MPVDDEAARRRRAVLARFQRTDACGERLGQHRYDLVGEIDAVAAPPRLAIERAIGTDIIADVGDRDDREPAALVLFVGIGFGPYRIVMVARIGGIDRDDRQVAEIFAAVGGKGQLRRTLSLGERDVAKHMRNLVLGDRDHAERARREGVPDPFDDLRARCGTAPRQFRTHEVADRRLAHLRHREVEPRPLVGGAQPGDGLAAGTGVFDEHADDGFAARL